MRAAGIRVEMKSRMVVSHAVVPTVNVDGSGECEVARPAGNQFPYLTEHPYGAVAAVVTGFPAFASWYAART